MENLFGIINLITTVLGKTNVHFKKIVKCYFKNVRYQINKIKCLDKKLVFSIPELDLSLKHKSESINFKGSGELLYCISTIPLQRAI